MPPKRKPRSYQVIHNYIKTLSKFFIKTDAVVHEDDGRGCEEKKRDKHRVEMVSGGAELSWEGAVGRDYPASIEQMNGWSFRC